jgi:CubicO group peptidase (beta-lactamase class C family)
VAGFRLPLRLIQTSSSCGSAAAANTHRIDHRLAHHIHIQERKMYPNTAAPPLQRTAPNERRVSNKNPSFARRTALAANALLMVGLALLASSPAMAADWAARHGLTGAQYQQAFNDFSKKGYRLTSISGYESSGGARYAALWSKQSGGAWSARHGLTPQQYQAAFDDFAKQGYRLTFINGYAVGDKPYYAAIWEKKAGPAWQARHGLTAEQYQAAVNDMTKQGYGLSHVSAFSAGGQPRFAAIFEKGSPAWVARHGLSAADYQKAFNDFTKQGYRLKVVSGYKQGNSDRYAAVWIKSAGPHWSARHGIAGVNYQAVFDNYLYQSYQPRYIEAFNSASGVRFNGLWENTTFKAQDLALIENKVLAYMKANSIPGMSIAISKDKRLVYAAGFGNADVEKNELVGPSHRFRIASVAKPVTVVAVKRVIQDTSLTDSSKVFGSNSVLGGQYATPSDNKQIEDITVDHLLRHRAGFLRIDSEGKVSDPMFAYTGTTHKGLIEWALKNYPIGYAPGSDPGLPGEDTYSNFGYSLLGRVIEARTGKTYENYVRDTILKPAGATGMVIGGDKEADRKPNEVKYYGGGAYSSVKPQRFDSHGGWIATPTDLLRFMRHETVLSNSYAHFGAMSGTHAVYRRRSGDGIGYAATANASNGDVANIDTMMKEIVEGVSTWPNVNLF